VQFHETSFCPYGNRCQFLHSQFDIVNKKIEYSKILNENVRLTVEKEKTIEDGKQYFEYANVF